MKLNVIRKLLTGLTERYSMSKANNPEPHPVTIVLRDWTKAPKKDKIKYTKKTERRANHAL